MMGLSRSIVRICPSGDGVLMSSPRGEIGESFQEIMKQTMGGKSPFAGRLNESLPGIMKCNQRLNKDVKDEV